MVVCVCDRLMQWVLLIYDRVFPDQSVLLVCVCKTEVSYGAILKGGNVKSRW